MVSLGLQREFDNLANGGLWKKKRYCRDRFASCKGSRCNTCICPEGQVYYEQEEGYCEVAPATEPRTTTTTTKPQPQKSTSHVTSTSSRAPTPTSSTITSTSSPTITTSVSTKSKEVTSESTTKRVASSTTSNTTSKKYPASATNSPTKSSVSRTNSPQTTKRITTTTASQGDKKMVAGSNDSHAGLIAGICVGFLVLIVCVVLILYFRKRRQKPKKVPEFVGSSDGFKFQDLKSRNEAERPVSPNGIYEYAYNKNVIGNPTYNAAIPISEPFYSDLDGSGEQPVYREVFDEAGTGEQPIYREVCDDEQPVYKEIVANEVYMSPEAAGHQEQPLYREVEEGVPVSPIYREIDADAPIYAMADKAVDAKAQQAAAGQDPSTYQQLNYAATANVYQGLSDDWKNQKYDR